MRLLLVFFGLWGTIAPLVNAQTTLKERLEKHVYTLADDSLKGRKAGSADAQKAAAYIVKQWEEIGIKSYNENTYYQPFNNQYQNLIGVLEGSDPVLKNEYIVVGAHYDHLGYKIVDGDTVIYNGADDNASGVATLIELSRRLKDIQPQLSRSIIFIAFDAEELGLYGSTHFANNPIVPIEQIKLMFSVDMVGWHRTSGYVKYLGSGTIAGGNKILTDKTLIPEGLHVVTKKFENSIFTATDTEGFAQKGIPTLAVFTGLKSPYHKPEDDADLIDYEGMTLITEHLVNVVRAVSQSPDFRPSGKLASKHNPNRKFRWGLTVLGGTNYHYYTAGAFNGKPAGAFAVGLSSQINMGLLALRPELLYEHIGAHNPAGKVSTDHLTLPLSFVLQTPPSSQVGAAVYVGGYYSYRFGGTVDKRALNFEQEVYRNEGGYVYGFELRVAQIKIGFTQRCELTNFSRTQNIDGANLRNYRTYATLTYLF
jgi:hypothetical protein